jgi:hypothetical protein
MILTCWEAVPDKRPSFKTLYNNASKIIEGIAGYLEIGFNPFTAETSCGEDGGRVTTESGVMQEGRKE